MFSVTKGTMFGRETVILSDLSEKTEAVIMPSRGANLVSFKRDGVETIFTTEARLFAPERPQCANPLLFPCCGALPDDKFRWEGKEYPMPQHGFACSAEWEVIETDSKNAAAVKLRLSANDFTKQFYPFDFIYDITFSLVGGKLDLIQTYKNTGDVPMPFTFGLHPHFFVGAAAKSEVKMNADTVFEIPNGTHEHPFAGGTVDFPNEYEAGGYAFDGARNESILYDKARGVTITVRFDKNFDHVSLWVRHGVPFVCIEPWEGRVGLLQKPECPKLMPSEEKTVWAQFEI